MSEITDAEIGRLAREWFLAETERVKARKARGAIRAEHPCDNERFGADGDPQPCSCYLDDHYKSVTEWCDNCQIVQPFWEKYREAAKKAQRLRYQLTRRIQRKLKACDGIINLNNKYIHEYLETLKESKL